MAEELQTATDLVEAGPVRPMAVRVPTGTIEIWGREFGPLAVAAAGGAAAGVAMIAVARARVPKRAPRRGIFRRREKVVASRSFLVDVHVLGR